MTTFEIHKKIVLECDDIIELRLLRELLRRSHGIEHASSFKTSDRERGLRKGLEVVEKILKQIEP